MAYPAAPYGAAAPAAAPQPAGWEWPAAWAAVVAVFIADGFLIEAALGEEWPAWVTLAALAADLAARVALGLVVGHHLAGLGAGRLKLTTVPATSLERTSPVGWGVSAGFFPWPVMVVLAIWRKEIRRLAGLAATAPRFASAKERNAARKAQAKAKDDPAPDVQAMRGRQSRQTVVFVGVWLGLSMLNRLLL